MTKIRWTPTAELAWTRDPWGKMTLHQRWVGVDTALDDGAVTESDWRPVPVAPYDYKAGEHKWPEN